MNEVSQQHNITYGLPAYLNSLGCFEAGVSLGDNGLLPLSKDWSLFDESEMKSVSCWSNYFCQYWDLPPNLFFSSWYNGIFHET